MEARRLRRALNLAVFDIDGTLTLGEGLGTRCFFSAFDEVFAPGLADRRLESYAESTDVGIAREAFVRLSGRQPQAWELEAFKAAYLDRLAREIGLRPRAYRPVPGADALLSRLSDRPGWCVAIATGNWRGAAVLKLTCAQIPVPAVTACSEDGGSRTAVLSAAVTAATSASGTESFERVVYVGDQPWDLHAAREAGAAFVGVGRDERKRRLEERGALVLEEYLDVEGVLSVLDRAAPFTGAATKSAARVRSASDCG